MSVAGDAGRCCPLLLVDPVYSRRNSQLFFFNFINWRERVYQSPSMFCIGNLCSPLRTLSRPARSAWLTPCHREHLESKWKEQWNWRVKSSRQPTHLIVLFFVLRMLCSACCSCCCFLRMLCLFLPCVVFCVCFIPDVFFCVFLSIYFLVHVLFRMFCSACFVPDVLFQSGHPPPPSPPAVPMERCQPTPLSAARAPPALWDSRKVVWSGSRSLTVDRLLWVVTAVRPYRWRHKPWRWVTMTSSSAVMWTGWKTSQDKASEPALDVSDYSWDFIRKIRFATDSDKMMIQFFLTWFVMLSLVTMTFCLMSEIRICFAN